MNKLKVLYIVHETFPAGATYSLIDMVESMLEFVEPVFITVGMGKVEDILSDKGWRFYRISRAIEWGKIGQASENEMHESYVANYDAAVQIANIIRINKIDLVHSNTSVNNSGAIAALMAHVPHVYHVRELMEEDFGWEYWNKELKKQIFAGTDFFISISKTMEQSFLKKYGYKTRAIYDGMVFQEFAGTLELPICHKIHKFIQVGVVTEGKGIWDTLNAARILKEKGIDNFIIQFIGKVNADVEKLIKLFVAEYQLDDNIELVGHCDDLQEYRYNAEFALVPSRFEGLGRVTAEAMAYGNIVIGANTGGTLELIGEKAERGYLFDQGNAECMADAILQAMSEIKKQGQHKRKLAFEFARSTFNISDYGKRIYKTYLEVLDNYGDADSKEVKKDILEKLDAYYLKYSDELSQNNSPILVAPSLLWDKWNSLQDDAFTQYFQKNAIHNVAVYGAGKFGQRLIKCLLQSEVRLRYIVDQNVQSLEGVDKTFLNPYEFYGNFEHLPCVDIVIIAVARERDVNEIIRKMRENKIFNVVLLSSIIKKLS